MPVTGRAVDAGQGGGVSEPQAVNSAGQVGAGRNRLECSGCGRRRQCDGIADRTEQARGNRKNVADCRRPYAGRAVDQEFEMLSDGIVRIGA